MQLIRRSLTALAVLLLVCNAAGEDTTRLDYQMPPKHIADLVDAPPSPVATLSPDRQWMVLLERPNLPTIEELAQPELRLAGLRINPRNNGPSRGGYLVGLTLKRLSDGKEFRVVGLPENPQLGSATWSPDSQQIAFRLSRESRIELWVADVGTAVARRLGDVALNMASGRAFEWVSDSQTLIARCVPTGRGEPPTETTVPTGPVVEENLGRKAPARTFQDLLTSPHDEDLFDYYATCQIVRLTLDGEIRPLGQPAIVERAEPSPDGNYLLVETIKRPYSYRVPMGRFPTGIDVWTIDGEHVVQIADLPLADNIPIAFGSVREGPRAIGWRADVDATLCWSEAADGGDAAREADLRDVIYQLPAPFLGKPAELASLNLRYGGIHWGNGQLAIASEWWWPTRMLRVWRLRPDRPDAKPELIEERSFEDRYADPGNPVMTLTPRGTAVILTAGDGETVFRFGDGASDEGDRPFLDKFNLTTKATQRLWRSDAPYYEAFDDFLDLDASLILTHRESVEEPPNYFKRNLQTGDLSQFTQFPHPTPQLVGIHKEQIRYKRDDGIDLTGTLYLPKDYDAQRDGPLPVLMWAYPQEYKSADAAGQVTDSPYRFVRVGWWSPVIFVTHGFAVLDDPTMPIIGEGDEEPNDKFIEQLVASARAAIEELDRRGVGDPERVAIGGHSYGAFMAANLLAHSDLFKAGLPRSGAYNRTLTPFGFQSEERTLWQTPKVYFEMSPFMHAGQIDEPILIVHGAADNNPGTFPMQSERLYEAIKGLGGTARLVMLPHESHGYRARESVMHLLWETTRWLDQYVKGAAGE